LSRRRVVRDVEPESSKQRSGARFVGTRNGVSGELSVRDAEREFVHPIVHAGAQPTAHPCCESWPANDKRGGLASPRDAAHGAVACAELGEEAYRSLRVSSARGALEEGEQERSARFGRLQRRMVTIDAVARAVGAGRSVVVVPSRTVDRWDEPPAEAEAYEQRMLSSLFELRDPNLQMTYVTSSAIAPEIINYYMSLLPRGLRAGARRRLSLIVVGDRSSRPLAEKLLERPRMLERIRAASWDPEIAHLMTYNASRGERDLALTLDLPIYGPDPRFAELGTKSGCRELFALVGIPHPLGIERVRTSSDVVRAVARLRAIKPELAQLVVKLNDGVSGEGNALLDLGGLPAPGADDERSRIGERVAALAPALSSVTASAFLAKLASHGGIVEQRITGQEIRSPSVQFQLTPGGAVVLLSTHDQILGGPSGQQYLGCRFPADPAYAPMIGALAQRAARHLADLGVIGRFAIDCVPRTLKEVSV
jgi:hypothetical protein